MFYMQLEQLCNNSGLSISTFVTEKLHMSKGNISGWRNGQVPSATTLKKIADYFGVTTDYLLTGSDSKISSHEPEDKDDLEQVILARSSHPIAEDDLKRIKNLIDSTIDTFLEALDNEQNKRK